MREKVKEMKVSWRVVKEEKGVFFIILINMGKPEGGIENL